MRNEEAIGLSLTYIEFAVLAKHRFLFGTEVDETLKDV